MNYRESMDYIESLADRGSKPGLDRIAVLCEKIGNPQNELKFIHVAGTNGKGSVSSYVYTILCEAGIKTGCFTSPAVMDYRERYRINGRNVSQSALCRCLDKVKSAAEEMTAEGADEPTQFEIETALAFEIFKSAGCEIVVCECGMGGAQDSTNIITTTLVSVITSISLDHCRVLGKNIEAITRQKAGIIKKGGHVVTSEQQPESLNVIKAKCSVEKADLKIVRREDIKNVRYGLKGSSFDYEKKHRVKIAMSGMYQVENAALAVACVDALKKERIKIDDSAIYAGLEKTIWPGRFQIIDKKPIFIIDGAHNPDAAKRLSDSVDYFFHNQAEAGKLIYIFGVLADKDYARISQIMTPAASHVITVTPPDNPRALPATELAETVKKYNPVVTSASSVTEALEMAYLLADQESVIVAFGTLSFLGRIREQVESRGALLKKKDTRI